VNSKRTFVLLMVANNAECKVAAVGKFNLSLSLTLSLSLLLSLLSFVMVKFDVPSRSTYIYLRFR